VIKVSAAHLGTPAASNKMTWQPEFPAYLQHTMGTKLVKNTKIAGVSEFTRAPSVALLTVKKVPEIRRE